MQGNLTNEMRKQIYKYFIQLTFMKLEIVQFHMKLKPAKATAKQVATTMYKDLISKRE